ncbi:MAG: hypothetical protein P4N60_23770 [Verrucomicrobiae bacterium]|nr:hypothetical protein [Verrucomicrobiae bacterium]
MIKTLKTLLSSLFIAAISLLLLAGSAPAQQIAYDEAGNYLVTANWTNGANQGFGFTPWAILTNGPDAHGTYLNTVNNPVFSIASITNVLGVGYTNVWGLYANGLTDINETTAFRGFTNSLGTNTFKLQWGSRGAGFTATTNSSTVHGWCGFTLRNGNSTTSADDFNANARFYLYFKDGENPATIYVWDGSSPFPYPVPGTSFSDLGRGNITNAIEAEVTVGADGNSYHLLLKDCVQNRTIYTTDSTLMGSGTIDSAALFCKETSGDQIYNRMQIAVPHVPPAIVNLVPTNTSLYVDASSASISFEVKSLLSTVVSTTVSASLNGVPLSAINFSTASPTSDLIVSSSAPLAPDTFYTLVITAQDANGDTTTNISNFNTFLATDLYIDCGDYNYSSGGASGLFVNSPTPANAYAGFIGSNNIDYFETDLTGTNNLYRPGDLPQVIFLATDSTGDPVPHAGGAFTIYSLGFTVATEWENYTRVLPPAVTNYNIYARAASGTGGQFEIERLTNAIATTTNQPLAALGRVNVPNTGGSRIHTGQLTPLTDLFGNTVLVPLSGTNTLRCTAISNQGYNLEYLLVVANTSATGTLRPYIASGSPAPGATAVATTSKINFTVANRQTTVTNVQLYLNGTNYSSAVFLTNNLVGSTVFVSPTNLLANTNNTITAIIADSAGVLQTNTWTFATAGVAGNGVWTGGAAPDLNWATTLNWAGGVPGPGFTAQISSVGGSTNYTTNSIVAANVSIAVLDYTTNSFGYHTTLIADGVTLTVSNGSTSIGPIVQAGGPSPNGDNIFGKPVTNTITGGNGTLYVTGNSQASGQANQLNFQVRQIMVPNQSNGVVLDMSGLGTMIATVGKFFVAQGGSGSLTNVSGVLYLARTNVITCLRAGNAGQFEVGDSSNGTNTLMGSGLYLGITNSLYVDTVRIGKNSATNNVVRFNPVFTNSTTPAVLIRGTNGLNSRVSNFTIGDADSEPRVLNYVQANVDFNGGKVDALLTTLALGRGEAFALDAGAAQGTLNYSAGTIDAINVLVGVQRAVNTATESGVINLTGTAILSSTNITLAQTNAGGTVSLVSGTINVTNGTVRGNINAGGGVSTVNLKSGTLVVSNNVGSAAVPLSALNLSTASLHFRADGNATTALIYASAVGVSGTSTITVDSVANVTGAKTIHLINYAGATPFAGLALAPLPAGFTGSLADSGTSIDLIMNVAVSKPPTIRNIAINGSGQVIIGGTNNAGAGGTYSVLTSTNLLVPLTNWVVLTSGSFDASGNFSSTNTTGTNTQQFYLLKVP